MKQNFEGYMVFLQLPGCRPEQFLVTEQVFLDGHCEGVPCKKAAEWKADIIKKQMPTSKVFIKEYKFTAVNDEIEEWK